MNKFSKMKVHWRIYNHCLFVAYLAEMNMYLDLDLNPVDLQFFDGFGLDFIISD